MDSGNYIFFIFQSILWTLVAGEDACRCRNHILCLHPGSSPAERCDRHLESGLTSEEKMAIVKATNLFRSRIAMGKKSLDNPKYQPRAADMMEVTWDDYLGLTSQRLADQCDIHESDGRCRVTGDGVYFGENMDVTYSEDMRHNETFLDIIKGWEDEVKNFPPRLVDHYFPSTLWPKYEPYVNLVYGKTYAIGCGRTRKQDSYRPQYSTYYVCHYKPVAQEKMPLYTQGEPASQCPKGSKISSKYEGLCAFDPHSGVSKNSRSAILIPSLFALVVMANKIQQFTAIAHY